MASTRNLLPLDQAFLVFQTPGVAAGTRSSSSRNLHLVQTKRSPTCKRLRARPRPKHSDASIMGYFLAFKKEVSRFKEHSIEGFTYPCEVRMSGFDMEIGEVKHNPMGEITKATVVDNQSFPRVYHLEWMSDCYSTKKRPPRQNGLPIP